MTRRPLTVFVVLALVSIATTASASPQPLDIADDRAVPPPPPEPEPEPERPATIGLEDSVGVIQLNGDTYLAGGFAVRRARSFGELSLAAEASAWILWQHEKDADPGQEGQGVMARVGASARYSLWRPSLDFLRGDFFVEGGLGYKLGVDATDRFHELDVTAGAGAGYDILEADPDSHSSSFSAYVVGRLIAPAAHLDRPGFLFSVGMQWQR